MSSPAKATPNRKEHAIMTDLMILRNSLYKNSESVRERLAPFPHAWRDMKLLLYLVNKVQGELLKTMPDMRVDYYYRLAESAHMTVEIPGPLHKGRHILITDTNLASLTESAMRAECSVCLLEGKEATRCPIRQALLEVAPPNELMEKAPMAYTFGCEYQSIASSLMEGKDVKL